MNNIAELTSAELIEELKKRTQAMFMICAVPENNTQTKSYAILAGDVETLLTSARVMRPQFQKDALIPAITSALSLVLTAPEDERIDYVIKMTVMASKLAKGLE